MIAIRDDEHPENVGRIGTVLRHIAAPERWEFVDEAAGCDWVVQPAGTDLEWAYPDADLRPIRDQPGADETLMWAGKPEPTETPIHEPAGDGFEVLTAEG